MQCRCNHVGVSREEVLVAAVAQLKDAALGLLIAASTAAYQPAAKSTIRKTQRA